jgi:3-hydroxyacyl-CoA dehydrogenase/enoyl-CoA hydratase/3-hydroxybutyryl-CoA epimerase
METSVRAITDQHKIVTVWLDLPGKPVNTCAPQLLADLSQVLDSIERERPAGVIFASAKPKSFNAGADLFEIRKMNREQMLQYLRDGQALFNRIANLPMPTVAAINGDCLGGGCELTLACNYRVAADDSSINIGLPEVKIGLIPAWGGTTRLPRILGLTKALPILLAGQTMPPRKALKRGLVDEVVRPEALLSAARRLILTHPRPHQPGILDRTAARIPQVRARILAAAERKTRESTYGNYPAPLKLLEVVRTGFDRGAAAGFDAELLALSELSETDATKNLMRLFFLRQGAKKWAAQQLQSQPVDVKYAAVIGGGTMGAGIAHALIRAGIQVRLIEADANALSAGLGRIKRLLDDDVAAGRLDKLAARHAFNRVAPSIDWTGLQLADLVIEAVVEKMDVKQDVFARLEKLTRPDCVLATNTSSLRVNTIAQATKHPQRVIGLHFFNPVNKMPLVEVIRGDASDDQSLATAVAVSARIGKTPIVVNDAPGFVVNRVLIPYLREAMTVALEGTPIPLIDDAMKRWGMPMGPFELLDEIGLDVAAYVLKSLARPSEQAVIPPALEQAIARGWLGKKSGRGFYIHAKSKRKSKDLPLNDELARMLAPAALSATPAHTPHDASHKAAAIQEIQWRLVLPMVNETARLLEEDVIQSTDALDLATVFGLGLAPFRGGLVQFANTVGAEEIVRRLDELASRHGSRFLPTEHLRELAEQNRPMAQLATMARSNNNHATHERAVQPSSQGSL